MKQILDAQHMASAMALATSDRALTTPNPSVGCVIAKGEQVIATGQTGPGGRPHAEQAALAAAAQAGRSVVGATAYVTLEPCAHVGPRSPESCAQRLAQSGVTRVVAAVGDPAPGTNGGGFALLRAAGIMVEVGLGAEAAQALMRGFFSRIQHGRPWITLKTAHSLDGRTALDSGESQWITGEPARADGHRLRAQSCAVLTGWGTVAADNPALTVRHVPCQRQPARVLIDGALRLTAQHQLADTRLAATHLFTAIAKYNRLSEQQSLINKGVLIHFMPGEGAHVGLPGMAQQLGQLGFNEVLVECGARLAGALLAAGLIDEIVSYIAPTLLGNSRRGLVDVEIATLASAPAFRFESALRVGDDLRVVMLRAG